MWKNLDVPKFEPEPFSENKSSYIRLKNAEIILARTRGKSHKHKGTNCDDFFFVANVNDIVIMSVADGAGSKKFSRIGAKVACESSVNYLVEELIKLATTNDLISLSLPFHDLNFEKTCTKMSIIMQNSFLKARQSVMEAFLERKLKKEYIDLLGRELNFKDFSSTLLLTIAIPIMINETIEYFIIALQVGDGMIAVFNIDNANNGLKLLGDIDEGNYAGETDFLTSNNVLEKEYLMRKTKISRSKITSLMLMTDGVSDDYFPNETEFLKLHFDLQTNGILKTKNTSLPLAKEDIIKKDEILKIWLDSYVKRGSFDDRTLSILNILE